MQAKAVLLSVFTDKTDQELHDLFTVVNDTMSINIDRVLINNTSYVNDIDCESKFSNMLTFSIADISNHELSFIIMSVIENKENYC